VGVLEINRRDVERLVVSIEADEEAPDEEETK
jgi:hypothetical protein